MIGIETEVTNTTLELNGFCSYRLTAHCYSVLPLLFILFYFKFIFNVNTWNFFFFFFEVVGLSMSM